jgi:hypothetical protein
VRYPKVFNKKLVGTYPAASYAGGGFVWDEVLEYRVWCHPERGAPDLYDGNDYLTAFETFAKARKYSRNTVGSEEPIALILQKEYIDEPKSGIYAHRKKKRITEWPVELLRRPRRTNKTIPKFLCPDSPANRLDIIRGNCGK